MNSHFMPQLLILLFIDVPALLFVNKSLSPAHSSWYLDINIKFYLMLSTVDSLFRNVFSHVG